MSEILHANSKDLAGHTVSKHEGYEYTRYPFVPREGARQCIASIYEVPPGKSAYPYHCHLKNEEVFYIISGQGILKTPDGERPVSAGDLLFFPATEAGAHKLTNASDHQPLVYLDVDTHNEVDVCLYPDSGKVAIWGNGFGQVYKTEDQVGYYEGE